jgi:hypothetical protein
MNEKATLRKFLAAWRGKDFTEDESKAFDITVLLGKSCLLSIIHKTSSSGSTYADIASVSMVPKGMTVPDQINDTSVLSYDNWDWDKFNSLPDFIKNKITSSVEYRTINAPETAHLDNGSNQDIPDDLPF